MTFKFRILCPKYNQSSSKRNRSKLQSFTDKPGTDNVRERHGMFGFESSEHSVWVESWVAVDI